MANAFVQATSTTVNQSGTTGTLAYVSNVTIGNLLIVSWRYNGAGAAHLSNITSTRTTGNWTIVYDQSDGGATPIQGGWAFAFATSTGANTVTMNFNTSVVGIGISISEHSGPVALRASSAVAVTNETALLSNAATAVAGDLQIGVVTCGAVAIASTYTAGAGYTLRTTASNGGASLNAIESLLSSGGGSVTASFTSSENNAAIKATVGLGIFTSQFNITGNAGVAGATVSYSGTASGSTTADGSGNYTLSNLAVGSYTITPTKTAYSFSPVNSSQTITNADISGVNFVATQLTVATPTFSPVAGNYSGTQNVTVNDTDSGQAGFAMFYTTDGSTPTAGSTPYTSPISVPSSLTIKVLAKATGYLDSNIGSAAYTIGASSFYSQPDCRVAPFGPNQSRTVQGAVIYDVQTSSNSAIPGIDGRSAGAPVDSRVAAIIPTNSRTPGTYGPGNN
jgi:hypothetical protein